MEQTGTTSVNRTNYVIAKVAERKKRLSNIARAAPADLLLIYLEEGRLICPNDAIRDALIVKIKPIRISDPHNLGQRYWAIQYQLELHDPIAAIQELNRMEGVYRETPTSPAEIHIHRSDSQSV